MRARICDNKKRNNKSHKQKNFTRWVTSRVRGSGQKKREKKNSSIQQNGEREKYADKREVKSGTSPHTY